MPDVGAVELGRHVARDVGAERSFGLSFEQIACASMFRAVEAVFQIVTRQASSAFRSLSGPSTGNESSTPVSP